MVLGYVFITTKLHLGWAVQLHLILNIFVAIVLWFRVHLPALKSTVERRKKILATCLACIMCNNDCIS